MANYKKMYITLFNEMTKAIHILQAAQEKTEELYVSDDTETNVTPLYLDEGGMNEQ